MTRDTPFTKVPARDRGLSSHRVAIILALAAVLAPASLFGQLNYPCKCTLKPTYNPPFGHPSALNGQVAIATTWAKASGASLLADRDLVIWNVSPPSAPPGVDWILDQYYSDPRWNYQTLGDVFGLTLDDTGNIYLAATTIYRFEGPNPVARTGNLANPQWWPVNSGDHGQIYQIANNTGDVSAFIQLPNPHGAGLGNITYDCDHGRFYVSNFDDGLIYEVGHTGNKVSHTVGVLNTWDHGMNLSTAVGSSGVLGRSDINPAQNPYGYAALGRRPFAVRVFNGRLYYSIWGKDSDHTTSSRANEVWSIALDSSGNFVAPARLEVIPPALNSSSSPWNNPVADITFTSSGDMILAERTMAANAYQTGQSRVLRYSGPSWTLAPATHQFATGCLAGPGGFANAAGGVDFDYTSSTPYPVWATAYRLHYGGPPSYDYVDGLQGFPFTGGGVATSLWIDLDRSSATRDDSEILLGDVKIPCPSMTITLN